MKENSIPFNKPYMTGKELWYISQAHHNMHLSGGGPFSNRCHEWFERRLGSYKAFLTHSCTAALEMAAILCDIQPGDEVIMPSFTFVSTANAFALRGAVPVFVDIREDTFNIDERLIEEAITSRTRAIVPVHYAGRACAMDDIMYLANRNKLWVIEDAAQALMSSFNGRFLGTIGHIGCLSFHETKNVISGEGGALLLNDGKLAERAEIIWEKGTNRKKFFRGEIDKYTWVDIGSSFLPSELIAAFLYAQLEQADVIIAKRRQIYKRYYDALQPLAQTGKIRLPSEQNGDLCNGHMFCLLTKTIEERTRLIAFLNESGVNAVFHYVPLHSSPAGRKFGRTCGSLQTTEIISDTLLRLPMYCEMTNEEVDEVVLLIKKYYL